MAVKEAKSFRELIVKELTDKFKKSPTLICSSFSGLKSKELEGLRSMIDQVSPDKIQLNTVVRPPSDPRAISLDMKRLEEIKSLFGEKAEVIAQTPLKHMKGEDDSVNATILEMAKRRPVRARDVANVCDIPLDEADSLIKGLAVKGALHQQEHDGEVYYTK